MKSRNKARIIFLVALLAIIGIYGLSVWKTETYNRTVHHDTISGPPLFSSAVARGKDVSVNVRTRSDTWNKIFDIKEEGLTEENRKIFYQSLSLICDNLEKICTKYGEYHD